MTLQLTDCPPDRYGLFRRSELRRLGVSDDQLAAAVASEQLTRLSRGVFMPTQPPAVAASAAGRQAKYRLECIAAVTSTRAGDAPLSHESAAALHGLPLLHPDLSVVHVVRGGRGGGSVRASRHRHAGAVPESEIVEVDGIRVTDLRRTALDLAQTGTFAQALTVVDGVLARGVSKESLHAAAADRTTTGIRVAQRAVAHGSGLSATVGESWSRAQMIDAALPLPQLQREYWLSGEQYFPDYDWDGLLIGEFDGLVKYRGVLREGEKPHDTVIREKLREDRFREAGIAVVRWVWADLQRNLMVPRVRAALIRVGLFAA